MAPGHSSAVAMFCKGFLFFPTMTLDRLAATLMQLRTQDLGIDYLDRRDALINGVTLEDANKLATRLLDPAKLTTVMVGMPQGLPAETKKETGAEPGNGPSMKPAKQ